MTFPDTPLPIQVDISLDGTTWTDITSDVRAADQIRITRGRSDWAQQVDFGRCSLVLSNNSGNYSPRNPSGVYYGQIGRNTPIRVSVGTGSVALDLPGADGDYATTPDTAALDITGDIDVRLDATLANWTLPEYPFSGASDFARTELIGKGAAGQTSWVLYARLGTLYFRWSADGSTIIGTTATAPLPLTTSGRLAVRATLDVDNGAGGWTLTFYTSDSINGTWTQLGAPVTGTGTTSIFSGTADLHIGSVPNFSYNPAIGHVHAAQVYNGINGTLVANPDFTSQPSGTTSFTDSAGRTWSTAGNAQITNRKVRFVGEIASWTPRWETGGFDVVTDVEAAGVLRRLGIGAVPTKSPFYREFTTSGRMAAGIVAYWPMEDGADATSLASAYAGHPSMTISGAVTPAAYADWVASDAIPTVDTGALTVSVPSYTLDSTNTGMIGFFTKLPAAGVTSTQRLMSFSQTGAAATWSLYVNAAGNPAVRVYDSTNALLYDSGFLAPILLNGLEKYITIRLTQSGTSVSYLITIVDIAKSMLTTVPNNNPFIDTITDTLTPTSTGRITQVRFGEDHAMGGTVFGHLAIGATTSAFLASAGVMVGWNAETGASRAGRIGTEENINSYATSFGDEQCGPQPRGTALKIVRAAGDVDEGILAEQRAILGLRYVTRASMYNQPAALTLNYAGTDGLVAPLNPVDDDQQVTNDVTVARTSGASARATLTTGSLSTQTPPNGIGLYDTSYTLGLLDDTQPQQHANWRLHIGTWDETRYPQVTVNLAGAPTSIENATAVDVGSRLQITNPPAWLPPDTIDLRVEGYTETMDQYTWTLVYNCSPHGPWIVAVTNDPVLGRADTAGSQLAAAMTSTATTATVLTSSGPTWTTDVTQLPFDISVGGETMQVEPSGTVLTTNPGFETDTSGWTPTNATLSRSQSVSRVGSWSALLTTGTGSSPRAEDTKRAVTAGSTYTAMGWLYAPATLPSTAGIHVNWYDAGGAYLTTTSNPATLTPGVWTPLNAQFTAPASAAFAGIHFAVSGTPGAGYLLYADNVKLITGGTGITSWLKDSFGRTVSNGWGTPDIGAVWTTSGGSTSDYSVNGSAGVHTLSTTGTARLTAVTAAHADFDVYCDITTTALATGDSLFGAATARMQDANNLYMARLEFTTGNAIILSIRKNIAGVQTQLGAFTLPNTYAAGTFYRVRFQGQGSTLRARAYLASNAEPSNWHVEATDTSLTAANQIGTRSIRSATNTNAATVAVQFDNYEVINPQTLQVTRSVNTVVKAQTAGTGVALATTPYIAL
jgi:hypothetical protein